MYLILINKLEELVKPERVQMATVDIIDRSCKGIRKSVLECNAIIHVLR
jgi:hypothetical protein